MTYFAQPSNSLSSCSETLM